MEKINFSNNQAPYIDAENLNQMQTNIEDAIEQKEIYSSEEQVIGTFFGKPLYKRTIEFTTNIPNGSYEIAHGISDVDKIWCDLSNSFISDSNISLNLISTSYYNNFDTMLNVHVTKNNFIVYNSGSSYDTIWTKYITLKYTKTTD